MSGVDEFAAALENIGRVIPKEKGKIAKAGAGVILSAVKHDSRFGKYAVMKELKSGDVSVYYDGETSSGYRAYGAAIVYEDGRKQTGRPYRKGGTSPQPARPFFGAIVNPLTDRVYAAMESAYEKIMRSILHE